MPKPTSVTAAAKTPSRGVLLLGLASDKHAAIHRAIERPGSQLHSADYSNSREAADLINTLGVDVVICGPQFRQVLRHEGEQGAVPVIVAGDSDQVAEWLDAIDAGAWDYLVPPFDASHVEAVVSAAMCFATRGRRSVPVSPGNLNPGS